MDCAVYKQGFVKSQGGATSTSTSTAHPVNYKLNLRSTVSEGGTLNTRHCTGGMPLSRATAQIRKLIPILSLHTRDRMMKTMIGN